MPTHYKIDYDKKIAKLKARIEKQESALTELKEKLKEIENARDKAKYEKVFSYIREKNIDPDIVMEKLSEDEKQAQEN